MHVYEVRPRKDHRGGPREFLGHFRRNSFVNFPLPRVYLLRFLFSYTSWARTN
jgi:hypothetical protein